MSSQESKIVPHTRKDFTFCFLLRILPNVLFATESERNIPDYTWRWNSKWAVLNNPGRPLRRWKIAIINWRRENWIFTLEQFQSGTLKVRETITRNVGTLKTCKQRRFKEDLVHAGNRSLRIPIPFQFKSLMPGNELPCHWDLVCLKFDNRQATVLITVYNHQPWLF